MRVLVTGCAGFIGNAVTCALRARDDEVIGVDNLNDYYSVELKEARLQRLATDPGFEFHRLDVANYAALAELMKAKAPTHIVHLAAQAGVRYSLENPQVYVESNLVGFMNILEVARQFAIKHLVYASSSSVYGANEKYPYSVHDRVDHPVSLYAATKKCNEVLAHSYSHLYDIPVTGLRYFTVYGPWGRPDMAPFLFVRAALQGETININNNGKHRRDFTYIDDIVAGTLAVLDRPAAVDHNWDAKTTDTASSGLAPYHVYNIGCGQPVELMRFVEIVEEATQKSISKKFFPKQPGDVEATWADTSDLHNFIDYQPRINLEEGIKRFVDWYKEYYRTF